MELILSTGLVIFLTVFWLIASWRYGDWKNWREYYPSLLFVCVWDFLSTTLTYEYRLWRFEPTLLSPNHTIAEFILVFLQLSPMIFVYLSQYPYRSSVWGQAWYMMLWVGFNSICEAVFYALGKTTYHHNWGFWWSVFLWCAMFIVIRIHQTRPLWAWGICFGFTGFVIAYFDIPLLNRQ